ncbi:MAG: PD-(D/E)XK nuclease domain-containing protein, partial [Mariprofundales bacterium]
SKWLDGVDMDKLRSWYNGYNFAAPNEKHKVYNPFDVLLYLDTRKFKNYWFETGSPSFLIRLLQQRQFFIPNLSNIEADESLLSTFDVNNIELEPLLFQTGYLTIESTEQIAGDIIYKLTTPNYEVWHSLHKSILNMLVQRGAIRQKNSLALYRCLMADNIAGLRDIFHGLFASIPHDWYRNNKIANYEGYYCSIVYCYFAALGLEMIAEDTTNTGQIDLTIKLNDNKILIFEFKVVEQAGAGKALQQIIDKDYASKYVDQGEIWLIGVEFSSENRNIIGFEYQQG